MQTIYDYLMRKSWKNTRLDVLSVVNLFQIT